MDDWLTSLPEDVDARFFRYRLPLKQALRIGAGKVLAKREGLLVKLEDRQGNEGWGEAAPLPGFSEESLEDVIGAARSWRTAPGRGPATLAFAIDGAGAELKARQRGIGLAELLGARRERVEVNALLNDGDDPVRAGAEPMRNRTIKLKVGRCSVEEDIDRVRQVHAHRGAGGRLRLDANRAWDLETARRFLAAVANLDIEYLEEPLRDPSELPLIASEFATPLALDETIREMKASDLAGCPWCAAIVLKPSLLGSLDRYRGCVAVAEELGMMVVISSAYESGVALRLLIAMAAALPGEIAHGFEPYRHLDIDVLEPRLDLAGHRICLSDVMEPRRILPELLEEVA